MTFKLFVCIYYYNYWCQQSYIYIYVSRNNKYFEVKLVFLNDSFEISLYFNCDIVYIVMCSVVTVAFERVCREQNMYVTSFISRLTLHISLAFSICMQLYIHTCRALVFHIYFSFSLF